jgi:hypothetical protein
MTLCMYVYVCMYVYTYIIHTQEIIERMREYVKDQETFLEERSVPGIDATTAFMLTVLQVVCVYIHIDLYKKLCLKSEVCLELKCAWN